MEYMGLWASKILGWGTPHPFTLLAPPLFYLPYPCKIPSKRLQGWDVVITVPTRGRPPLPNTDDYRIDTSRYDIDFLQEEGLLGNFTINLEVDDKMIVDDEEDEVVHMEEDTPRDEVEEVKNQHDLTLLE
jgi:hypothetical protein